MRKRIYSLKEEMSDVGIDLSRYGKISFFRSSDFDYLKRKYILLQLRFMTLIEEVNNQCDENYIPIMFFFEIDDEMSERQGFILDEISDGYKEEVAVFSFDKDYEDEPLVQVMLTRYNITEYPATVIAKSEIYQGIAYSGQINATIRNILKKIDPHAPGNFNYVLDSAGLDKDIIINELTSLQENVEDPISKGDISLIIGRLSDNESIICESLQYYDDFKPSTPEQEAMLFETVASLDCGRNVRGYLFGAADAWNNTNNFRSNLMRELALGEEPNLVFEPSQPSSHNLDIPPSPSTITVGQSSFTLTKDNLILSQVDRVSRDWLSSQLNYSPYSEELLTTFSERRTYSNQELVPSIGWHEGARIKELITSGAEHITAPGTLIANHKGKWYAPDDKGIFRFEVPIDKVLYPTTRFLAEDIAVVIDTHGINMLVEQAMRHDADVVIGCCDHPGKVAAAEYLAEQGKTVICFPDKYLSLLLGNTEDIFGSPPMREENNTFIIGDQPVTFSTQEKIVVSDVENITNVPSYYDTPSRYFRELEKQIPLDITYVTLDPDDRISKLIKKSDEIDSHIIGARIFNLQDYIDAKQWLQEPDNRMILFHSMPYPYGYKLLQEFPLQTSFGDLNPTIK